MTVRFHLDEHVPTSLANALRTRGIDTTTTVAAGLVGASDEDHLAFANVAGRVIVTQDIDFLRLHREGVSHSGIAHYNPVSRTIGEVLRRLVLIHAVLSAEEMRNRVEYL